MNFLNVHYFIGAGKGNTNDLLVEAAEAAWPPVGWVAVALAVAADRPPSPPAPPQQTAAAATDESPPVLQTKRTYHSFPTELILSFSKKTFFTSNNENISRT